MSEHPDLFGLLHADLGNAEAIAAGDHLAGCRTCQEELAEAAVGHALLTRAGRALGPVPTAQPTQRAALPPPRPARRWRSAVAVAAAVVLAAGLTGAVLARNDGAGTAPVARGVDASLTPLSPDESGEGTVRMVEHDGRTRMTFALDDLPSTSSDDFYYAWLLDPSTNKMLALGLVGSGDRASFDLDDALVASYSAVDVSLESNDGDPAHSATSVLRGSYEPNQITTAEGKTR
jgi:anti-sigma-K factor RskA